MPICKLNDLKMSYAERGAGPALVLLHGFPLDGRIWEDAQTLLQRTFRVITPDLRGFGQSSNNQPFTIESLADDVHQFLAALGALPCILGGLSMGGYIALAYAKKYPSDLRGLALINTKAAADSAEGKLGRQQMIELVRQSGTIAIVNQMFPKMMAAGSAQSPAAGKLRSIMEACPPLTIEHALGAMRDREDYMALLGMLAIPILIVAGEQDAIVPLEVARGMHSAAPGSRLAIIKGAGHMSPIEQPAAFAEAIKGGFLKKAE
jgi:pimeloyl-ACP methyl ester carboxylesterase